MVDTLSVQAGIKPTNLWTGTRLRLMPRFHRYSVLSVSIVEAAHTSAPILGPPQLEIFRTTLCFWQNIPLTQEQKNVTASDKYGTRALVLSFPWHDAAFGIGVPPCLPSKMPAGSGNVLLNVPDHKIPHRPTPYCSVETIHIFLERFRAQPYKKFMHFAENLVSW